MNDIFGSKIEQKLMDDPMMKFGDRLLHVHGHRKRKKTPSFEGWLFDKDKPEFKGRKISAHWELSGYKVRDARTGLDLTQHATSKQGVITYFRVNHVVRLRFCLKVFLGFSYFRFGEEANNLFDLAAIRAAFLNQHLQINAYPEGLEGNNAEKILYIDHHLLSEHKKNEDAKSINDAARQLCDPNGSALAYIASTKALHVSIFCLGEPVGSVAIPADPEIRDLVTPRGEMHKMTRSSYRHAPIAEFV